MYSSTQDGKQIDENFADYVSDAVDDLFDQAYDKFANIDENSQVSFGKINLFNHIH